MGRTLIGAESDSGRKIFVYGRGGKLPRVPI